MMFNMYQYNSWRKSRCSRLRGAFQRALVLAGILLSHRDLGAQGVGPSRSEGRAGDPAVPASANRSIPMHRVTVAPVIDGRLDDPVWDEAPIVSDFVQRAPLPMQPSTLRTEVRLLSDATALYVAMRMLDSAPDSIIAPLARRDYQGYSDWAEVLIDSYHDRRSAVRFALNPSGVKLDAYLSEDSERSQDLGWDAVWQGAAARDADGWTAEFRIPLSQLRFAPSPDSGRSEWGVEFVRDIARRGERAFWAPVDPAARGFVSLFGTLTGMQVNDAGRRAEVIPYLLVRRSNASGTLATPASGGASGTVAVGADFKVGLTSDLTATGTVNPDFGQVEADPSQINLTGAELFFPERRAFFSEGSDLFAYDLSAGPPIFGSQRLFHSRRIGRQPQLALPAGALDTSWPEATRVVGASKVSGQLGAWSLGALNAVTEHAVRRYSSSDGTSARQTIEPLTRYAVLRIARRFDEGASSFGIIVTATNRRLDDSASASSLPRSAYTGGFEAHWRFGENYQLIGYLLGSRLAGSRQAVTQLQTNNVHLYQRPDLRGLGENPAASALTGTATSLRLEKMTGGMYRFALSGQRVTPGFDINDVGFLTSSDFATGLGWVGREQFRPTRLFRLWRSFADVWVMRNLHGPGTFNAVDWWNRMQFHNFWEIVGSVQHDFGVASASVLRGGPALRLPSQTTFEYRVLTDPRRTVSWDLLLGGTLPGAGGTYRASVGLGVTARPSGRVEVFAQAKASRERASSQYVGVSSITSGARYLVGELVQRTYSLTQRFNFALSHSLTLQGYATAFLSGGWFSRIGVVVDPLAPRYRDRVRFFGDAERSANAAGDQLTFATGQGALTVRNPDFSFGTVNANLILRWEYRAGSALSVVWNHGRRSADLDGRQPAHVMLANLFDSPRSNVLLVKWGYYVGR